MPATVGQREVELQLELLWSKRWWIVISIAVFTAAAAAAAFLVTPKYRAVTILVGAETAHGAGGALMGALGDLGGLASVAGINVGANDADLQEALAVLRSREFTERFIQDFQLMPALFDGRWDARNGRWKGEPPTLARGSKVFDQRVRTVSKDNKTGLIVLAIEWRDPVQAASWANALVTRLNAEMRARAIARASAAISYLQKELASTSEVETKRAMDRVMEAQINKRMLATVTEEYALRVVDRALPPDTKDIYSPNRPLLLVAGPITGLVLGVAVVLLSGVWPPRAPR